MKTSMLLAAALGFAAAAASIPATAADIAKGRQVFRKCAACHAFDDSGKNRVGPNLFGVFGRAVGTARGYPYSKGYTAAGAKGVTWTAANLEEYLANPRKFIQQASGDSSARSKMVFQLSKKSERDAVIEYLKSGN